MPRPDPNRYRRSRHTCRRRLRWPGSGQLQRLDAKYAGKGWNVGRRRTVDAPLPSSDPVLPRADPARPFLGRIALRHRLPRASCSFLGECRQLQLGQLRALPPLEKHRWAKPGHRYPCTRILLIEVNSRGDYRRTSACTRSATCWRPDLLLFLSSCGFRGCSFEPRR